MISNKSNHKMEDKSASVSRWMWNANEKKMKEIQSMQNSNSGKRTHWNSESAHKPDADEWTLSKINKWNWNENRETRCGGGGKQVLCKIGRLWSGREKDNAQRVFLSNHFTLPTMAGGEKEMQRECMHEQHSENMRQMDRIRIIIYFSSFFCEKNNKNQQLYTEIKANVQHNAAYTHSNNVTI